jgi:hypothetical protein
MSKRAINLLRKQLAFPMDAKMKTLDVSGATTLSGQMTNRRKTITASGGARILLASESGATVFLGGIGFATVTLPAMGEAGVYFDFMTIDNAKHIVNGGNALLQGCIHHNTAATTVGRVAILNITTITLHATIGNRTAGDRFRITSNGTKWYVEGLTNDAVSVA